MRELGMRNRWEEHNMNQMQALLEKARNDKELMAKLDALGASGAGPDKIVALAAEYGFSITEEDYRKAAGQADARKTGELKEEDLEAASGGGQTNFTQNRYDPNECVKFDKVQYRCVGFLAMCFCDHYKETQDGQTGTLSPVERSCAMGCFSYKE